MRTSASPRHALRARRGPTRWLAGLVGLVAAAALGVVFVANGRLSSRDAEPTTPAPTTSQPTGPSSAEATGQSSASSVASPSYGFAWRRTLSNGPWPTAHVQGIAVDARRGFVYYSFTTLLVKTDLTGRVLGTLGGFRGHLGDLEWNPADGRIYGSLEYKPERAFYIAIIDGQGIDRQGMSIHGSSVMTTVYLPTVVKDYSADLDGNGTFAGDTAYTRDHRYGCSGIDGVSFGPQFGTTEGKQYLTVAYGIYQYDRRGDNDHQVFLQYDIDDWTQYEHPLRESNPRRSGPAEPAGTYFVLTGNTHFGVQSLEYDASLQKWLFSVYPGSKARFPNYSLYAIDASSKPRRSRLAGLSGQTGLRLTLADAGQRDPQTGIRGWRRQMPFGFEALGNRQYYIVSSLGSSGRNSARTTLQTWVGSAGHPFQSVGR